MWDRGGFQGGNQTQSDPDPTNTTLFQGQTGGDIHIAYPASASAWTFENNATAGATTAGQNDGKGPGGGQYFYQDGFPLFEGTTPPFTTFSPAPNAQHQQVVIGGMTVVPGKNEVLTAVFDPIPVGNNYEDQGVHIYNILNGSIKRAYRIVDGSPVGGLGQGPSAKDAGLGDLEPLCSAEAVEIGNKIWKDTDGDGIQDPGESALASVNISLYKTNGTKIGQTTTNNDGYYVFNPTNVDTTGANGTAGFTGLKFGDSYYIVIGEGQYINNLLTIGGNTCSLTQPNVTIPTANDENDSDGISLASGLAGSLAALAGYPSVLAKVGGSGGNKQNFDFGFQPAPTCILPQTIITQTPPTCNGVLPNNDGKITITAAAYTSSFGIVNGTVYNGGPATASSNFNIPTDLKANVPNTGGTYTIHFFNNTYGNCDKDTTITVAPIGCAVPCASGNLGGRAWRDFNSNGIRESNETVGEASVTVKIYDCSTTGATTPVATTTTDANGDWFVSTAGLTFPVRVEFALPRYHSTFAANNSKTTVQFVAAADCNIDLGVQSSNDYCQTNPNIVTPCFNNGDGQLNGTAANQPAIVNFQYNDTGDLMSITHREAASSVVGSTFGMTYSRKTKKIFASAFTKRHMGFGPLGISGIYAGEIVGTNLNFQPFAKLADLGIDVGTDPHTGLTADANQPNHDPNAYDAVGKTSFGDLDIADDETALYTVNLKQRTLVKIALNDAQTTPTAADVSEFAIPITCPTTYEVNGQSNTYDFESRPFALKYYNGKVLVGVACVAANDNFFGWNNYISVYEFDPSTGTFNTTPVFGPQKLFQNFGTPNNPDLTWSASQSPDFATRGRKGTLFTDIEVDAAGNLYTLITSRAAYQTGWGNFSTDVNDNNLYSDVNAFGHVCQWQPNATGNGWRSHPTGERWGEKASIDGQFSYYGGMLLSSPNGELMAPTADPINFTSGGTVHIHLTNGTVSSPLTIFSGTTTVSGKAAGLGDMEALCAQAPKQIGNYVWLDANGDGVQDPCETPLSGVKVKLYKMDGATTTLVATTTTNANGNYLFSDDETLGAGFDTLVAGKMYFVVLGEDGQFNTSTQQLTLGAQNYQLSTQNTGVGSNADANDADAYLLQDATKPFNGYPVDTVTMGGAGYVNHTLDFGLKPAVAVCSITATFTQGSCNNNGTTSTASDDYFTVTVSGVTASTGGASNKYEVVLNGVVLNIGGTAYGTSVTVGSTSVFSSDGTTTYTLQVRDLDIPTCATTSFTTTVSASCSTPNCPPVICVPVTVTRSN
jgi:SdrD B-like domain